ncbi:hypothetical protein OAK75_10360 [Bacteriovoracales bacterium]|nr:hypothetical protein [Bacteriovoracales bacterium]
MKTCNFAVLYLLVSLFTLKAYTQETKTLEQKIDEQLKIFSSRFRYAPTQGPSDKRPHLYELGQSLFSDKRISMAGDTSCATCHQPQLGTGDGLPLSIGTGGTGDGLSRTQGSSTPTLRNAPPLYNKTHPGFQALFWDGRVSFSSKPKKLKTPNPNLNGENPVFDDIVSQLDNASAAQSLFPLINEIEMRGHNFSNLTDREVWDEVFNRVIKIEDYKVLFKRAFPNEKWNIGHVGKALAHFQDVEFSTRDTGWDKYLKGDLSALSLPEKKGALTFTRKGRCFMCHNGKHLTNFRFENIMVPHLSLNENFMDKGRGSIDKRKGAAFQFMVSPLRNVGLTAPYFHNGSMATIEEVIEHYNEPLESYNNYNEDKINELFEANYHMPFISKYTEEAENLLFRNASRSLHQFLALTEEEKENLSLFLKISLTEKRFVHLVQ